MRKRSTGWATHVPGSASSATSARSSATAWGVVLDEGDAGGAARGRLEAERPGAGVEVEHPGVLKLQQGQQPGEQPLAGAVGGRPGGKPAQHLQAAAFGAPDDDAGHAESLPALPSPDPGDPLAICTLGGAASATWCTNGGVADMDLDLSLAASFLVLAEERHYGRAATRLNVSSSALTKRIQRLERQLGVLVLDRGPGGVLDLTPAGQRFATEVGPLLVHAEAVRSIARTGRRDCVLRLGIPAGTAEALRPLDLAGAAREVRSSFPQTRLVRVDVDFSELTRCLPDGQVDVLFTSAPVQHAAVTSERLGLTSRRIGLVGRQHALADAGSIDVADYMEQSMIFNPSVPSEWMSPSGWVTCAPAATPSSLP